MKEKKNVMKVKKLEVDQNKIINYLSNINRRVGKYRGMLEAIAWWDVPQGLKDRIAKALEEGDDDNLEVDFLIDK